ncbi:34697_t:CDS:2, partial [Gigaspora margarita]
ALNELSHSDTSNTSDENSSDTENFNSLTSNSQTQKNTNQSHPLQVNLVNNSELKIRQNIIDNYVSIDRMDRNELLDLEYKFAKALLNKVYEDVKNEVEIEINNIQNITIVSDGWSNINHEPVQNFIVCTPKPLFYDSIYSEDAHHTAEWISAQIIKKMEKIGIQKFSLVITDTASNMKSIIEDSKTIVKFFKSHNIAMVKLQRIQKENYKKEIALVLSALTRWGTHLDCIKSLMKSQTAIQQMLFDSSPIIATLKAFENKNNNLTISIVYSCFNTILLEIQKIECSYSTMIQQNIQTCWNYIYHPIMTIAYILEPHYFEKSKKDKSICLTTFADFIALKYSADEASRMYTELLKFRNKQIPYNNQIIWNSATYVNSTTWWTSWPSTELQKFAIRTLSIPTSSASAERNYSNFGFIHSKVRNRLKNERVKKLVYIYGNLRMQYIKTDDNKNIDKIKNCENTNTNETEDNYINDDLFDLNADIDIIF